LATLFAPRFRTCPGNQDIAELVLKGALRFVGVDPPKRHDVQGVARFIDRFPAEWRSRFDELEAS
jgi:HEPN domain-containing protein